MADDAFNMLVIAVRRGIGPRQHEFGVKDIQSLVFHCSHVEVVDGDYHVQIQVVFQTVDFLVPAHGVFQGLHGVRAFVDIMLLDKNLQGDTASAHGHEFVAYRIPVVRRPGRKDNKAWRNGSSQLTQCRLLSKSPPPIRLPLDRVLDICSCRRSMWF